MICSLGKRAKLKDDFQTWRSFFYSFSSFYFTVFRDGIMGKGRRELGTQGLWSYGISDGLKGGAVKRVSSRQGTEKGVAMERIAASDQGEATVAMRLED